MKYQPIPLQLSLVLRYLHQEKGESLKRLTELYPQYTRTSIYRHMKKPIGEIKQAKTNVIKRKGRPRKYTERDERHIIAALKTLREEAGNFSVTDIQNESGLFHISRRTIRRILNRMGYRFKQCRKKGILVKEDLDKRLKFAKQCKRLPKDFWIKGISFYLDGVSFVYKKNPSGHARTTRTRTWMKKGESLSRHCTTKGKKEGVNGRVAKFMCAISHKRGFIEAHHYTETLDGEMCKAYIEEHFPAMFVNSTNPKGKLFLQDGDPSQNSKLAREAMDTVGCRLFKIPARSPDLNPIENTFNNIRSQMRKEAVQKRICNETFQQFCRRVQKTILDYNVDIIDRTIESMPKRIDQVIKTKGLRLKY